MSRGSLILNEDANHFMAGRTPEEMSPEGVDALADVYAKGTQVAELVLNPNAMRASVDSKVKQPFWEGFDPEKGNDQPYFANTREGREGIRLWVHNMLRLHQRGIDPYRRWIDRARTLGAKPWISVRMNDLHQVDEPGNCMLDRIWNDHPETWRATWREFESPHDRALDYGHPSVREHFLAYVRECAQRWDMDGIELDWMRQPWCLRAGHEEEGAELLTRFTADVRKILDAREKQLGHSIGLSARIPSHPEAARRLGYDTVAWARKKLVTKLVPTPGFGTTEFDIPIELWKQLLHGTGVVLAPGLENFYGPFPFAPLQYLSIEMARGAAASFFDRGADQLYLFNFMDRDPGWPEDSFDRMLRELGSPQTLAGKPRRHLMTWANVWPPGLMPALVLPYRLGRYGYRPTAEFRIPCGPKPAPGEAVRVALGLYPEHVSETTGQVVQAYGRKIRTEAPAASTARARELIVRLDGRPCTFDKELPQTTGKPGPTHTWRVPDGLLRRGDNVIEVRNPTETVLSVEWVEVSIG